MKRSVILSCSVSGVLALGACTTSKEVSASKDRQTDTARRIVGTALIGTRGASPADQDKVDETAARLRGAKVWTPAECARHGNLTK